MTDITEIIRNQNASYNKQKTVNVSHWTEPPYEADNNTLKYGTIWNS